MNFSFKQLISELKNEKLYNQELDSEFIFFFKELSEEYGDELIRNQAAPLCTRQKAKKRSDSRAIKLEQSGVLSALTRFYFDEGGFVRCKEAMIQRIKEYVPQSNLDFITQRRILSFAQRDVLGFEHIDVPTEDVQGFSHIIADMANSTEENKWYEAILYVMFALLFPVDYMMEEHRSELNSRVMPLFTYMKYHFPRYFGGKKDTADDEISQLLIAISRRQTEQALPKLTRFSAGAYNGGKALPSLGCTVSGIEGDMDIAAAISRNGSESYMITGSGGSGKTFALIRLAQQLSDSGREIIPLYISLNEIDHSTGGIKEHIISLMIQGSGYSYNECRSLLEKRMSCEGEGQLLLLLDGFNEIGSADMQAAAAGEISRLICCSNVRAVVTSRYDMSSSFVAQGAEHRFVTYKIKELSAKAADDFIHRYFEGSGLPGSLCENARHEAVSADNGELKPVLRTPMGLIMYCAMKAQSNVCAALPHKHCTTMGELADNYLSCIKSRSNTDFDYSGFIGYIGYVMNDRGVFRLSRIGLLQCAKEYFGERADKAEGFFADGFARDVMHFGMGNGFVTDVEFVHQNYRDLFAACYLKSVLCGICAGDIDRCFGGRLISAEVLSLLGDIIGEHNAVQGGYSLIQDVLSGVEGIGAAAVAQLVRTAAAARGGDLSCFDFGGLDLTCTSLNGIKLYKNSRQTAGFAEAVVSQNTFAASGHEGAVFEMLYICDRYLLSFAKKGVFCFDMQTQKYYKAAHYRAAPIHSVYHLENRSCIITGDMDGNIILWRYSIEENELSIYGANIVSFESFGNMKFVDGLDLSNDVCSLARLGDRMFAGVYGGILCEVSVEDGRYALAEETIDLCNKRSILRMCEGRSAVYVGCGNELFRLMSLYGEELTVEVFPLPEGWEIKDVAVMRIGVEEHLLINARNSALARSCVYELRVAHYGSREGFEKVAHVVCTKEHSCARQGFRGWKSFCEQVEDIIWLTADIEDAPESASLLRICAVENGSGGHFFVASECCPCRHTMAINCAVAFEYKGKKHIATGSTDRSVELLSAEGGDVVLLQHLGGHVDGIHSIEVVEDGRILASHYGGEVSMWSRQEDGWRCTQCCGAHSGWVWQSRRVVHGGEGYIISCSYDNTISVIREDTEELICRITEPTGKVLTFGMLSDTELLTGYISSGTNVLQKFRIDYDGRTYKAGAPVTENGGKPLDELRYIATAEDELLLCANNDIVGKVLVVDRGESADLDSISFTSCEEYSEDGFRINLRCADEISYDKYQIRVVGGDRHGAFGEIKDYIKIIVSVDGDEYTKVISHTGSGCSAVKLFVYNGSLHLAVCSYGNIVYIVGVEYIGNILVDFKSTIRLMEKPLSVQQHNGTVYISTLDGRVYGIAMDTMTVFGQRSELLFESVSGYRYCNTDLSRVRPTDWDEEFRRRLSYYAKL